jgi:hypothetical protein
MAGSTLGELKIDGRTYSLDELTLGELEGLEDHMGLPLSQVDVNSARAMRYLVYTVKLREDPGYTMELAGQVRVIDLLSQDDDERPTEEAAADADAAENAPTAG